MPKLSILLPAYNAQNTVKRAAESCLNQSFNDLELIIINDGSIDRTENICDQMKHNDQRIKLISLQKNQGVAQAVEMGRQSASGKYIARMDADDYSYPDRFIQQIQLLDNNPSIDGCGTSVRLLGATRTDPGRGFLSYVDWINSLNDPTQIAAQRFVDSPIANPTSMVRSIRIEEIGGFPNPKWAEDYDLWLTMLEKGMKLTNIDKVLLDWYDSPERLTRSSRRYSLDNFSKAKAHYLAKMPDVLKNGIQIAGAGPIGKRLAKDLVEKNVKVTRFYEIDQKKINQKINKISVHDYSELKCQSETLVSAVCRPGAREKIRKLASSSGYIEGVNFFCAA